MIASNSAQNLIVQSEASFVLFVNCIIFHLQSTNELNAMKIHKSVIFWLLVANITGPTALAEHDNLRHLTPCTFTSYVVNSVCLPCPWWLGEIGTPDKKSCTHCPAGQVLNAAKTACVSAVGVCDFISHVEDSA